MSRPYRAWMEMERCKPVSAGIGAGERAGLEEQAPLGPGSVLGAASSITRLVKFLAASMLVIAAAPASALAGSVTSPTTTQVKQQSAPIHPAGVVVLAPGSGYLGHGSAAVHVLQSRLARAGYTPGPIDGRYGPRTEQAVARFQAAHGLHVDGIAGSLTLSALSKPSVALGPGTGYLAHGSRAVRALQRRLTRAGYPPGPIDGRYGPRTEQAARRFQATHGLLVDGIAGPQTLAYLSGQRPVPPQVTRRSHPTGSPHRADLRSRRGRLRPQTVSRQPGRAPAAGKVVPVSHSTDSPPLGLLVLLIAPAVAVGLSATWLSRRSLHKRYAIADAGANGASRSDADAIAAHSNHTTTSNHTTPRRPAATLNAEFGALDDADRAFRLALLLEKHGNQMGAVAAYRRADQLGHGAAAANLGVLLEQQGDRTGAMDCFRRAEQRGEASGAFDLADLLEAQGDQVGAMAAYRRADQLGHGVAATNLGVLLEQQGDRTGAKDCFQRAEQRGEASGAFNLAVLLEEERDQVGAIAAYRRAEQLGDPTVADMARAAATDLTSPIAIGKRDGHDGP